MIRRFEGYKDYSWMEQKYVKESLSSYDIGRLCSLSATSVQYWLRKHGIIARPKDAHLRLKQKLRNDAALKEILNQLFPLKKK